jgi:hypothetical protein
MRISTFKRKPITSCLLYAAVVRLLLNHGTVT